MYLFSFSGSISPFYRCSSLQKLILCYNEIKCEIDGAIGDLVELRVLYISHNKLSGRIPDRICDLLKLTHLNLSHNHIGGTLPRKFGENQGLKVCILGTW
jgi:Leucine-rich repeat (LRR) protein